MTLWKRWDTNQDSEWIFFKIKKTFFKEINVKYQINLEQLPKIIDFLWGRYFPFTAYIWYLAIFIFDWSQFDMSLFVIELHGWFLLNNILNYQVLNRFLFCGLVFDRTFTSDHILICFVSSFLNCPNLLQILSFLLIDLMDYTFLIFFDCLSKSLILFFILFSYFHRLFHWFVKLVTFHKDSLFAILYTDSQAARLSGRVNDDFFKNLDNRLEVFTALRVNRRAVSICILIFDWAADFLSLMLRCWWSAILVKLHLFSKTPPAPFLTCGKHWNLLQSMTISSSVSSDRVDCGQ